MFYVILIFALILLVFVKQCLEIPLKLLVPMSVFFVLLSASFSQAGRETVTLDDAVVPFGAPNDLKNTLRIQENDKKPILTTNISYDADNSYDNQLANPTLDILPNEEVRLEITLEKGYSDKYSVYLPGYKDKNVFEITSFDGSGLFVLDEKSFVGSSPSEVVVLIKNGRLAESASFALSLAARDVDFDTTNSAGIKAIDTEDFKISFKGSKTESEKIRVILSETELTEQAAKFSVKASDPNHDIGLDVVFNMKVYNSFLYDYVDYEKFVLDKSDTYKGGLVPTGELEASNLKIEAGNVSYTCLAPKTSYYIEMDKEYQSLFFTGESPIMYFSVSRGGSIIKGYSKNVEYTEPYWSFVLKNSTLLTIKLTDADGSTLKNKKFTLYGMDEKNEAGVNTGVTYSVNGSGYLQNAAAEVGTLTLQDSDNNLRNLRDIIKMPSTSGETDFLLVETVKSDGVQPIIIEIYNVNNNGFDSKVVLRAHPDFTAEVKERKMFRNKINDSDSYLKLFDVAITGK